MKEMLPFLASFSFFLAACSHEKRIIKKALRDQEMIKETAMYFIAKYSHKGSSQVYLNVNDSVDEKYKVFLQKLQTPWVQVNYNPGLGFIEADSVVLFTRAGIPIIGNEHDILYDFKTESRASFTKAGNFQKCYKIADRIFYIKAAMPEF